MNRTEQISFYKRQLNSARELRAVAEQNISIATQLESEAKSALEMLGASTERSRKGNVLPEQLRNSLRASLTK
ncbi:hypothetical protein [Flavobacterium sp.]|uniref:hypothetical protein n=1 Tax=Flavobacterium sp. TaxID=239 RepID=UPI0025C10BB5|nr:hypothetical protein [Flavobacterium sp.]MBA4155041.1 hypothetical protein [Flavobacterium sp.]